MLVAEQYTHMYSKVVLEISSVANSSSSDSIVVALTLILNITEFDLPLEFFTFFDSFWLSL